MEIFSATVLTLLGTLILCFYLYAKKKYRFFEERGLPYAKPIFLLGSTFKALTLFETLDGCFHRIYKKYKNNKIVGFFQFLSPAYLVVDPELIEKILIKDFSHFTDHVGQVDVKTNPLDGHLFNLNGRNWKTLRGKLSPIFTAGKLKWMFDQILACSDNLVEYFDEIATGKDVTYKPALNAFESDVIASCAFGFEVKSLKNPDSKFFEMSSRLLKPTGLEGFKIFFRVMFPKVAAFLKLKTVPANVEDYFINLTKNTMMERLKNSYKRNDFLELMLQLKQKGYVDHDEKKDKDEEHKMTDKLQDKDIKTTKFEFTDEVLAAQCFVFAFAGLETSSVLKAYTLYLLSKHPEIQEKLRQEIKAKVEEQGEINYDALNNMTYFDCVISESLRIYAPTPFLVRQCTKTYKTDDLTIEKESLLFVPIYSLHLDEQYFEEPEKFIPDRFLDSKYSLRQSCGTYLPFGDGPRVCIARRFALLESKIALAKILLNFEVEYSPKNIEPLVRNPRTFVYEPKGGLFIRVKKLKSN